MQAIAYGSHQLSSVAGSVGTVAMHNTIIGSTGIDQDNHLSHDNSYSNEQWVDMNAYTHMGMTSYGGDYYIQPPTHGLPSESIGMAPPPIPHPMHSQTHHNNFASHLPHPLIIPTQQPSQVPWPSLRTNPSQSYSAPPVPIPPASAPVRPQPPRLTTINTSQPRKTLTDEDRRNMCLFHEDNPHAKQTEIGQKFGVERSTVSKVLRRKELYLNLDSQGGSPVKKAKGKSPPDIERALANWVRGQQKKGVVVSDSQMEEKARVFCTGSDSPLKTITASWIEKFKQKHNIGPGKLIRRASETAIPDNARLDTESPLLSTSHTPGGISPASPINHTASPLVSSATEKSEGKDSLSTDYMSFDTNAYRHPHSQSSTSLSSAVTDPPSSTFSAGAFSPASQFNFSPDPNTGMFGDRNQMQPGNPNFQRPRSQTVPDLGPLDYINQSQPSEPLTPKYSQSGTAPSSALESPTHEMPAPPFGGLDSAISPTPLHHVSSNSSLAGRSSCSGTAGVSGTTMGSSPSSPTQEDARRAADTLLNFMQQIKSTGLVNQNEFMIVLGLTEKLGLQAQQPNGIPQNSEFQSFGGLSRIPEGDTEMTAVPSPLLKNESTMSI